MTIKQSQFYVVNGFNALKMSLIVLIFLEGIVHWAWKFDLNRWDDRPGIII
jgi:hypothetical protein